MTTVLDRPVGAAAEAQAPRDPTTPWISAAAVVVVAAGLILRFFVRSDLWLDETLSVNIARLPLGDITGALRHDGAPPLYYLLLHGWMTVFGTGDLAVRALSGVCAVVTLPALYLAGRRIGGTRVGAAALLIGASSPFANHYATETRMYALLTLIVVLGYLALANALERPTVKRLALVSIATAALLYTHYWSLYLLVTVAGWLAWRGWRSSDPAERVARGRALAAMAVGALAFLPWVPIFLYQAAHTGTPWGRRPDIATVATVIDEFAGGGGNWAQLLAFVLFSLALLGLFGRAVDHRRVELDLHTIPRARGLAAVFVGTPLLAILAGMLTGTAFVARYTSVVFPAFCLLVALGVAAFADRRTAAAVLAVATGVGLWCSFQGAMNAPRTQAGEFAGALKAQAQPDDVLVFCPDQLGPGVARKLSDSPGLRMTTYPRGTSPVLIDWVDYKEAVQSVPVDAFAADVVRQAGAGHDVWLVAGRGYRPYDGRCTTLIEQLTALRPGASMVVRNRPIRYFEHGTLYRFPG